MVDEEKRLRREQASSRLFALRTDEVCMQATFERVMSYLPLKRLEAGQSYSDAREEAPQGIQRIMLRTQLNGRVLKSMVAQVKQVELEVKALKRFINCQGVDP